jgi:hypothetical protein
VVSEIYASIQKDHTVSELNEQDTGALAAPAYAKPVKAEPLRDDLIWGIRGIAEEIGKSERQAFHMVDTGAIPAAKVGGRVVASRARLREHFRALLDGKVA